jgi:hypothetical protein
MFRCPRCGRRVGLFVYQCRHCLNTVFNRNAHGWFFTGLLLALIALVALAISALD